MARARVPICRYYIFTCLVTCSHRLLIFLVSAASDFLYSTCDYSSRRKWLRPFKKRGKGCERGDSGSHYLCRLACLSRWKLLASLSSATSGSSLPKALFSRPSKVCKLHGARNILPCTQEWFSSNHRLVSQSPILSASSHWRKRRRPHTRSNSSKCVEVAKSRFY